MHVFDPGMRFWPQPSQLKMPKYAAASNSGCVSFAALAARGSAAAATNELAAACAKNWRREWSTAGTRVLCCWRAGTRVLCCWRAHSCWRFATHTATRQKWRMARMQWPLSALCTVPAQLAGLQSQPWHASSSSDLGTGFFTAFVAQTLRDLQLSVLKSRTHYRHTA